MDMLIQEGSIVLPFVKAVVQGKGNSNQGPKNQKNKKTRKTRKNRSKNYIG
jgi:hypothetical protein